MRSFLLMLLPLLLAGCGYHAPGAGEATWAGRDGRTLHVELFVNRTAEPYLDSVMTEEASILFSRSRLVTLTEDRGQADLMLGGTVKRFDSRVKAHDESDRISEYVATMTVNARLQRRSDGAVLWQGDLTRSELYPAIADRALQQEGVALAARVVARRIAEDLQARLLDHF